MVGALARGWAEGRSVLACWGTGPGYPQGIPLQVPTLAQMTGRAHRKRGWAGDRFGEAWVLWALWFDTPLRETPGRLTTNGGLCG